MNCFDYQSHWNDRLDKGLQGEPEASAVEHEACCEACRVLGSGYLVLSRLLPVLPASDRLAADFTEKVLKELTTSKPRRVFTIPRRPTLAAAAVLLLGLTLGLGWKIARQPGPRSTLVGARESGSFRSDRLSVALSDASRATWTLARDTSAPAARVGGDVIGVSSLAESATRLSFSLPIDVDSSAEVLQQVGRRVNEGVRPLSGTARSAFGFLLGTSRENRTKPSRPRSGV